MSEELSRPLPDDICCVGARQPKLRKVGVVPGRLEVPPDLGDDRYVGTPGSLCCARDGPAEELASFRSKFCALKIGNSQQEGLVH